MSESELHAARLPKPEGTNMKKSKLIAAFGLVALTAASPLRADPLPPNPMIDYAAFLANAGEVDRLRSERRISEDEFIEMSKDSQTIILDARSDDKYHLLHVRGARHLSLPDFTDGDLARVIPGKDTRILIYCNNNFANEPVAFPGKAPAASLNIYTFNALYSYGYRNVYELGPLIDIRTTKLPLEGMLAPGGL
jgi:hypothetical protein